MADDKRAPGANNESQNPKRPVLEDAVTLTGKRKKSHPAVRWIVSIACVVAICGVGYWAATELKPEEVIPEATEAPDYSTKLIDHKAEDVVSATVTYGGKSYTVKKHVEKKLVETGGSDADSAEPKEETVESYVLEGMEDFSLDQDAAKSLMSRGTTLSTQATVAEDCQDLATYGLDAPVSTLRFDYTDGSSITLELGDKSPLTYYYLKLAGDDTVYSVYSSVADTMMKTLEDMHTVAMPGTLDPSNIQYVKLERPENGAVAAFAEGEGQSLMDGLIGMDGALTLGDEITLPTSAPATEAPAVTEAPAASEAPATEAPVATEVPATEAPATEAPAATEEPATSSGTGKALAEGSTAAPETSEAPAVTEAPAATEIPATEAPAASEAPTAEPSAEPVSAPADEDMTVIEVTVRDADDSSLGVSGYKMVQPFEYDVDSEALQKLATSISSITIESYVGNISEEGNPYGMESPIKLTARDANGVELSFMIGARADDTHTYICVDDTGDVYLTKSSQVEFARTLTVAGIVDRFANIVNITKVDSLDVDTPSGSYELKIDRIPELDEEGNVKVDDKGKEVVNEVYYFGGEETDGDAFKKLYQQVIGILVNGVNDDFEIEGEAAVTVTYHLNVEPGTVVIEYIDNARDTYAVRRDGKTLFYVNKSKINEMMTALANYQP